MTTTIPIVTTTIPTVTTTFPTVTTTIPIMTTTFPTVTMTFPTMTSTFPTVTTTFPTMTTPTMTFPTMTTTIPSMTTTTPTVTTTTPTMTTTIPTVMTTFLTVTTTIPTVTTTFPTVIMTFPTVMTTFPTMTTTTPTVTTTFPTVTTTIPIVTTTTPTVTTTFPTVTTTIPIVTTTFPIVTTTFPTMISTFPTVTTTFPTMTTPTTTFPTMTTTTLTMTTTFPTMTSTFPTMTTTIPTVNTTFPTMTMTTPAMAPTTPTMTSTFPTMTTTIPTVTTIIPTVTTTFPTMTTLTMTTTFPTINTTIPTMTTTTPTMTTTIPTMTTTTPTVTTTIPTVTTAFPTVTTTLPIVTTIFPTVTTTFPTMTVTTPTMTSTFPTMTTTIPTMTTIIPTMTTTFPTMTTLTMTTTFPTMNTTIPTVTTTTPTVTSTFPTMTTTIPTVTTTFPTMIRATPIVTPTFPTLTMTTTMTTTITTVPPTTTAKPMVCGSAPLNSRLAGGSSVETAGIWPWMASLQRNGSHVCGGTLVSEDHVLSNAECFSSSTRATEWKVILGLLKLNGSNPFEVTLNVKNITLSNLTGSNVAVLTLATRPPLSNYIQPICMDNGQTFAVGTTCWAAGWSTGRGGSEELLQVVQTSVVDCGSISQSDSLCTGAMTLEQGDAGGPLMCKLDGSWFQAAVLTVNNNNNSTRRRRNTNPLMVFTKLSRFEAFLTTTKHVRQSQDLSAGEQEFVHKRKRLVQESLNSLGINCTADSVPHIAFLASGGGQRAAVALVGSLYQMKEEGLLDTLLYLGGVSGSTWSMSSLYNDSQWSSNMEAAVSMLGGTGVGLDEALAWLGKRVEDERFSLTDVWGIITAAGIMKQMDERRLSNDATQNITNPYPVYSTIEKHCYTYGPIDAKWFELTPHEAGFTEMGLFIETSLLGSKFHGGELQEEKPEMDMIQLQGILGCALAHEEIVREIIPPWLNVPGHVDSTVDQYMRVYQYLIKLVALLRSTVKDPAALSELQNLQNILQDVLRRNDSLLLESKTPEERKDVFQQWSLDLLAAVQNWSQSLEDGPFKTHVSGLAGQVLPLIVKWDWGSTQNFLYQYPNSTDSCLHSMESLQLIDAGLLINVAYPPFLGDKRDIDLIIAPEYSAGGMFETLTLGRDYAARVKKPFPHVDDKILQEKDWPKDCYVFQGEEKEPTIVFMPLFNRKNCKDADEIKAKMEEFSTFQLPFNQEKINFLLETAKTNMKNNMETLLREMKRAVLRRQNKSQSQKRVSRSL
ncbi:hypothetical protein LDENG_00209450 [Lucifuga dentata]|nr:hypothetical protein LDENG_00209450 [Lucifuga dentata]